MAKESANYRWAVYAVDARGKTTGQPVSRHATVSEANAEAKRRSTKTQRYGVREV